LLTHVRMALIHLVVARAKNLRRTIDMGNARSRRAVSVARRPLGMSTLSDESGELCKRIAAGSEIVVSHRLLRFRCLKCWTRLFRQQMDV
jgi:hypothetical protein